MTTRTVSVRLQALIGPYSAALAKATRDTKEFKQELGKTAREGSDFTKQLGTGMLVAGGAVALGFGKMVQTGMGFEKQMSGVQAVSGATAEQMQRLSDAALKAGASTKLAGVTASDAAAAQEELVKAGVSVDQILGGALMGSLTLASAGQLEFADAATIAAQAMNIFDLAGSDVTHVADVLAAAANKSAADVGQLGDALRQGGLVASQTGLSLEETVGALAAFADNALIGSDAGTSLKTMLQRLTPQSAEAASLMEELGFSAYDASGNFIGLEGLTRELQDSLGGMTVEQRNAAMATLFGSDAVRGANVLYSTGAEEIRGYIEAVNDQGAAAEMAAAKNDNLSGDIEALGGAIETVMIKGAGSADDAMRGLTQTVTTMVNGLGALEGPAGGVALGFTGIVGAASLAGGAALHLAPKVHQAKEALNGMGNMGKFAAGNMGKFAGALGVAGIAVAGGLYLYGKAAESSRAYQEQVDELAGALAPVTRGQKDLNEALAEFLELQMSGLGERQVELMNTLGVTLADIERSIQAGGDALDPLRASVAALGHDLNGMDLGQLDNNADGRNAAAEFGEAVGFSADEVRGLVDVVEDWDNIAQQSARSTLTAAVANGDLKQSAVDAALAANALANGTVNYAGALEDVAPAAAGAVDPTGALTDALADQVPEVDAAAEAQKELEDAIKAVTNAQRSQLDPIFAAQDALEGHRDAQDALKGANLEYLAATEDVNKAVQEHGEKSDEAAAAWLRQLDAKKKVEDADRKVQRSALDVAAATTELKMRVDDGSVSVEKAEAQLRLFVAQGLLTEQQAYDMAQELRSTTTAAQELGQQNPVVRLSLDSQQFWKDLAAARFALAETQIAAQLGGARTAGLQVASGGYITGKGKDPIYRALGGPSGTDTVPAWLTPGEYVVKKSAVDTVGLSFMHALNATRAGGVTPAPAATRAPAAPAFNMAGTGDRRGSGPLLTIENFNAGDRPSPQALVHELKGVAGAHI